MDALHALTSAVDALTVWLDGQCPAGVTGYTRVAPATTPDADGWFVVTETSGHGTRTGLPMAGDSTAALTVDVTACASTAALASALFELLDERLTARAPSGAWAHTPDVGPGLLVLDRDATERAPLDVVGGLAQRGATFVLTVHRSS